MRLNKFLAFCGLGSRRKVETLVTGRRVTVNDVPAETPALRVCGTDVVKVDGVAVKPKEPLYLVMNKPRGFVCSLRDPHNKTLFELLPQEYRELGLFTTGRLDKMSEGLLILTNDGDMAFRLSHPREGTEKTYDVLMENPLADRDLQILRQGTWIGGKHVRPVTVGMLSRAPANCWVRFVLGEGVKREIRRISTDAGLKVKRLIRVGIGKLWLATLHSGEWRNISKEELARSIDHGGRV